MDKSFLMVFLKKINIDPTSRQNFGDAPGQIPKLILTLCLMKSLMFFCAFVGTGFLLGDICTQEHTITLNIGERKLVLCINVTFA